MPQSRKQAGKVAADQPDRDLQQAIAAARRQLEAERAEGTPTAAQIERSIADANAQLEVIRARQARQKERCKRRKREIADWQDWCQRAESGEKPEQLLQMQNEVAWRHQQLHAMEQEIADLYPMRLELEGRVERLKAQLIALQAGVYERPVEEDPRLQSLIEERDRQQRDRKLLRR